MLLGHKISDRVAEMRSLPKGIDQRSASRHPDWTGPDDLEIKINELREITDWEKPVFVKVGATRTYYDVQLAVKAGADVIVVDGMQGGTAATQDVFIEHVGIPTLPATRIAADALQELGMHRQVQLIVSGGIRSGADVAKALALGADAVSIGTAALVAMGDNSPEHDEEYREIGSAAGFYDDWQAGRDPAGISTQDDELAGALRSRSSAVVASRTTSASSRSRRRPSRERAASRTCTTSSRRISSRSRSRLRRWRRSRSPARTGFRARARSVPSQGDSTVCAPMPRQRAQGSAAAVRVAQLDHAPAPLRPGGSVRSPPAGTPGLSPTPRSDPWRHDRGRIVS